MALKLSRLNPLLAARDAIRQRVADFRISRALEDLDITAINKGWDVPTRQGGPQDLWDRHLQEDLYRSLYWKSDIVRNIVNNYALFIVGNGFQVIFRSKELQERWNLLDDRNDIKAKVREAVLMTVLMGNWFHTLFPKDSDLKLDIRSVDPGEIENVKPHPHDRETILGYEMSVSGKYQPEVYSPLDIHHWHVNKLGSSYFGRSILEPVIQRIGELDKLIKDQLGARRIKNMVHYIRYLTTKPTIPLSDIPGKAIIEAHKDKEEWDVLSKDVDASGAQYDILSLTRFIAAGVQLPVEFIMMDVSGSPSSEMHMESVPVKLFESLQEHFTKSYRRLVRKMLHEDLKPDEFDIIAPPVDIRTATQKSSDLIQQVDAALISRRTAQEKLGYDPLRENQRINNELGSSLSGAQPGMDTGIIDTTGEPLGGGFGGGGGGLPSDLASLAPPANLQITNPGIGGVSSQPGAAPAPTEDGIPDLAGTALGMGREDAPIIGAQKLLSNFSDEDILDSKPSFTKRIVCVDDGFATDCAIIALGLTNDNKIVAYRENYIRNIPMLPVTEGSDSRSGLIKQMCHDEKCEAIIIDPSALELASILKHMDLPVKLGSRDAEQRFADLDKLAGEDGFKITSDLPRLRSEIQAAMTKQGEAGQRKKPASRKFHGLDAVSYGVAHLIQ